MTRKQQETDAAPFYAECRRAEIERNVKAALATLDGSREAAVQLLSGLSPERIEKLGGAG